MADGHDESTGSIDDDRDARLETAAREAVERGVDVREEVRALTTEALTGGRLDTERTRRIVDAVMDGVSRGAAAHAGDAGRHAREAAGGLDEALAHAAQAVQLTVTEARARFEDYGEEDLRKAREDLRLLEALMRDAAARLARSSDAVLREVWTDVERHWRASGTEVGRQASRAFAEAAEQFRHAGSDGLASGWNAALGAGAQIADVASGVLAGLADALEKARDEPPGEER